ncbi:hypothetical protein KIN20_038363 [Parelaphostrongylus tenuis]|uniref:Uncharacterized protein n=1 Tax=Parelaphostrongylus tenuis TaxID=148309 RepID=A0AAD5REY8_PARTN|nr:hypothetical protein KIN20_038363 [Parelaphostrongylus tenuis]
MTEEPPNATKRCVAEECTSIIRALKKANGPHAFRLSRLISSTVSLSSTDPLHKLWAFVQPDTRVLALQPRQSGRPFVSSQSSQGPYILLFRGTKHKGRNRKRLTADEIITAALRQRMISEGRIRAEERELDQPSTHTRKACYDGSRVQLLPKLGGNKSLREYKMVPKAMKKEAKEEEVNEMVGYAVGEEKSSDEKQTESPPNSQDEKLC